MFGPMPPIYVRPFDRAKGGSGVDHLARWDRSKAPVFEWPANVVKAWDLHQAQTLKRRPRKDK